MIAGRPPYAFKYSTYADAKVKDETDKLGQEQQDFVYAWSNNIKKHPGSKLDPDWG